jgi:AcrR family transcriptional regulator
VRKKRGAYHHGQLRDAMIEGALAIVASHGVTGLSLRDVARRIGVSQQAPYRHFADKRALLEAIAADGFRALVAALRAPGNAGDDPTARLIELGCSYVKFARDHAAHYRVMFTEPDSERGTPPPAEHTDSAFHVLAETIALGQRKGVFVAAPPRELALASFAFVHGLAMLVIDGKLGALPAASIERLIAHHVLGAVGRG